MKKLLFIGDPHFNSSNPISRADNYREITMNKLIQLKNICINNNIDTLITTGDMFSMLDQSLIYMNQIIDILRDFKNKNIQVLTIIGNHDLPRNNLEFIKNSPVYTLIRSGLIHWIAEKDFLTPIQLNDTWCLYGLDYSQKELLSQINYQDNKKNILVMHYGTDNTVPADNIPIENLLKFDLVVSGHDHHFYEPLKESNTLILRPGSLTRTTREKYNLERDIIAYEVVLTDKISINTHKLNVNSPDVAFKNDALSSTEYIDFYNSSYGELFNKEFLNSNSLSLEEIIMELPITVFDENKEYFKKELLR